jgi:fatty-acyl-CoA synthase
MSDAQVMNLSALLAQTAALHPDRPGLIQGERQWTWREINARVDALVQALRELGMQPGDKLLVQSRNGLPMFESCWAAFRLGAVWVPTNFRLTPTEVAYLGGSSEASVMLCEDVFPEHIDAVRAESRHLKHVIAMGQPRPGELNYEDLLVRHAGAPTDMATVTADQVLWYFYTSGTTGRPKAGMLTHGQLAFVITNHLADLIPGTRETDCSIAVAPLSHGAGIHALLNVARGAATVLLPSERMDPAEVWRLV